MKLHGHEQWLVRKRIKHQVKCKTEISETCVKDFFWSPTRQASLETRNLSLGCLRFLRLALYLVLDSASLVGDQKSFPCVSEISPSCTLPGVRSLIHCILFLFVQFVHKSPAKNLWIIYNFQLSSSMHICFCRITCVIITLKESLWFFNTKFPATKGSPLLNTEIGAPPVKN